MKPPTKPKPKRRVAARFVLSCNERAATWKQRVAAKLRDLADRVDGRESLALRMESNPPLPESVKAECVHAGLLHLAQCVEASLIAEVNERRMQRALPHLYDPDNEVHTFNPPPTKGDRDER